MPDTVLQEALVLLTDLDDTLTESGHLPSSQWPCDAVIGETGAFAFYRDTASGRRQEIFAEDIDVRKKQRATLDELGEKILREIPAATLASDQPYRLCDLAIDLGEDVPALDREVVERVLSICSDAGAIAVPSACHVNAWFGDYNKLSMAQRVLVDVFGVDPTTNNERVLCIGDSANDLPLFQGFTNSVGVANVRDLESDVMPSWVTQGRSAAGFLEFADRIIAARAS